LGRSDCLETIGEFRVTINPLVDASNEIEEKDGSGTGNAIAFIPAVWISIARRRRSTMKKLRTKKYGFHRATIFFLTLVLCNCNQSVEPEKFDGPIVTIVFPTEGTIIQSPTTVICDVFPQDTIHQIQYTLDGELIGTASSWPYSFTYDPYYFGYSSRVSSKWVSLQAQAIGSNGKRGPINTVYVKPVGCSSREGIIISPRRNDTISLSENVTLRWHTIPQTKYYQIQTSSYSKFQPLILQDSTTDTLFHLTQTDLGEIYWRIRGVSKKGAHGCWLLSGKFFFSGLLPPRLQSDLYISPGQPVTFSIGRVEKAKNYEVVIAKDTLFMDPISSKMVSDTTLSFGVLPNGIYFIRARSINNTNEKGIWSEWRSVCVGIYTRKLKTDFTGNFEAATVIKGESIVMIQTISNRDNTKNSYLYLLNRKGEHIKTEKLLIDETYAAYHKTLFTTKDSGFIVTTNTSDKQLPFKLRNNMGRVYKYGPNGNKINVTPKTVNVSCLQESEKGKYIGVWSDTHSKLHVVSYSKEFNILENTEYRIWNLYNPVKRMFLMKSGSVFVITKGKADAEISLFKIATYGIRKHAEHIDSSTIHSFIIDNNQKIVALVKKDDNMYLKNFNNESNNIINAQVRDPDVRGAYLFSNPDGTYACVDLLENSNVHISIIDKSGMKIKAFDLNVIPYYTLDYVLQLHSGNLLLIGKCQFSGKIETVIAKVDLDGNCLKVKE